MLRETFPLGRIASVRIGGHWSGNDTENSAAPSVSAPGTAP